MDYGLYVALRILVHSLRKLISGKDISDVEIRYRKFDIFNLVMKLDKDYDIYALSELLVDRRYKELQAQLGYRIENIRNNCDM